MLTSSDAIRSLHWYVARFLLDVDDDYDIRVEEEETKFTRPCALVQTAGPTQMTINRRVTESIRPFTIYIYPPEGATTKAAKFAAEDLVEVCRTMFGVGGHGGHPARIPNFDWDEIEFGTPLPDDAEPIMYLRVQSLSVDERRDPDNPKLRTVVCDLRLRWITEGRLASTGPLLTGVNAHPKVS